MMCYNFHKRKSGQQLELCWAGEFVGSEGVKEITVL